MADIIIAQKQIVIKVFFVVRIIVTGLIPVAFILIGIKQGWTDTVVMYLCDRICHLIQGIRSEDIVMVKQSNVSSRCKGQRLVRILCDPRIFLEMDIVDPGIRSLSRHFQESLSVQRLQNTVIFCGIREDQLPVRVTLLQYRRDHPTQIFLRRPVEWHDHTEYDRVLPLPSALHLQSALRTGHKKIAV